MINQQMQSFFQPQAPTMAAPVPQFAQFAPPPQLLQPQAAQAHTEGGGLMDMIKKLLGGGGGGGDAEAIAAMMG